MSDVSSDWNEVVGEWEFISGKLHELRDTTPGTDGTADAVIICTQPVPASSAGEMFVQVKVHDPTVEDKYYIYPCATSTSAVGVIACEFYYTSVGHWTVTVRRSGTEKAVSHMHATLVEGNVTLLVCADHLTGMVVAQVVGTVVTDDTLAWCDDCDPGNGRYAGLGHNNVDTGALFDDFVMGELRKEDGTHCYDCWCWCLKKAITKTVTLTFYDATNRSTCMEGESMVLTWDYNNSTPVWYGTMTITGSVGEGYNGTSVKVEAWLSCDMSDDNNLDWPGHNWTLELKYADGDNTCCSACQELCNAAVATDESECDALNLIFGPYLMAVSDGACYMCYDPMVGTAGTYMVAITE